MSGVRRLLAVLTLAVVLAGVVPLAAGAEAARPQAVGSETCDELAVDNLDPGLVQEYGAAADDVFIGKVNTRREVDAVGGGAGQTDNGQTPLPSDQPRRPRTTAYEHGVTVMPVFAGDLDPGLEVIVVTQTAAKDGLGPLRPGQLYLFFATRVETGTAGFSDGEGGRPRLEAPGCAGTTLLPRGFSASLRQQLDRILAQPAPTADQPPRLTAPEGGSGEPPSLGRAVAPGAALGLIGILGLLLLSRVGTRRG